MLTGSEKVSAFELAYYLVTAPLILFLLIRHRKQGILGWLYLILFCGLRLAGAGLTVDNTHPGTGALINNAVGLSPLLLGAAGLIRET